MKPGIYNDLPIDQYHAAPGISKTGLWTIYKQSPAHYRFGERKENQAFDFGQACHFAILQPEEFERQVFRGPEDRRGNKWKDAQEWCAAEGKLLLTAGDHDAAATIRDAVHSNSWINSVITGGVSEVETSGFWNDPRTGTLCRCRPDLYREDLGIILDLKTCTSAAKDDFMRSVINYGYHAQEAFYSEGWRRLDKNVDGFVFLAVEKTAPYAFALYELPPSIVSEGYAIMRKALNTYAECEAAQKWPAYSEDIVELEFPKWAYRETEAPNPLDEEAPA